MEYKTKEIWKTIDRYNKYEASNFGNIRNKNTNKLLKPAVHRTGYLKVDLSRNPRTYPLVHRLVMYAFCGDNKLQVNHKDGNKQNNRLDNLEYVNNKQNSIHTYKNGNTVKKLTIQKVMEIKKMNPKNKETKKVAEQYGVTPSTIRNIVTGRRWGYL